MDGEYVQGAEAPVLALIGIVTAQAQVHPDIVDFQRARVANLERTHAGEDLVAVHHHDVNVARLTPSWALDDRRCRLPVTGRG